jgi:hypothetical protein
MSKVTFYGLPAWVGAIQGPTICDWWSSDPAQLNWDRSLLNTVDLSMTPSAATAGRIKVSQIEVDDFTGSGGRTTIGPMWPGGTTIGACWVSDGFLARVAAKPKPGKPSVGNHEYMTIQYFDGEQHNRRFHGFQANVTAVQSGLSRVELWHPGTGTGGGPPAGAWWLDLAAVADPNTAALSPGKPGPLFLDVSTVRSVTTFETKIPPFHGGFALCA